jgi:hypothetical protein
MFSDMHETCSVGNPQAVVKIDVPVLQMKEVYAGRWRCCFNCVAWRENADGAGGSNPTCTKFGQRPPTEVIVVGCQEWFASGIPF